MHPRGPQVPRSLPWTASQGQQPTSGSLSCPCSGRSGGHLGHTSKGHPGRPPGGAKQVPSEIQGRPRAEGWDQQSTLPLTAPPLSSPAPFHSCLSSLPVPALVLGWGGTAPPALALIGGHSADALALGLWVRPSVENHSPLPPPRLGGWNPRAGLSRVPRAPGLPVKRMQKGRCRGSEGRSGTAHHWLLSCSAGPGPGGEWQLCVPGQSWAQGWPLPGQQRTQSAC